MRRGVGVGHEEVLAAVAVEVGDRHAAAVALRVEPVARRLVAERPALVVEEAVALVAGEAAFPHRRPVAHVGQVHALAQDHLEDQRHVALRPRRHPAVDHEEVEPAVVVVVEELPAPTPPGVVSAGLAGHVGEARAAAVRRRAVVVPEEVALAHVVVGDVGDVDVRPAVAVVVPPLGVHALLGVDAERARGDVAEARRPRPAVVDEEAVGAEVAGDVEVLVAVAVGVAVAEVEGPAALREAGGGGLVGEAHAAGRVRPQVAVEGHAAAVLGGLEALGEEARRLRLEEVDRLEVGAHEQVEAAVAVGVEGEGGEGVGVGVEPGLARHLAEAAAALRCGRAGSARSGRRRGPGGRRRRSRARGRRWWRCGRRCPPLPPPPAPRRRRPAARARRSGCGRGGWGRRRPSR